MTTTQNDARDEAQIRALIDERAEAVRARDVDRAMSFVAPDIVMFDVVNAPQSIGAAGSRQRTEVWFSSFEGPIGYEMRDLSILTGGDLAVTHSLNRYSGTQTGGVAINMWVRATVCYRRIDSRWMITHEHQSVPFDGQTGRASLDLSP
ncbi:MAG: nuclear transport factor 2 family protein [Chloroflexota bacterium]